MVLGKLETAVLCGELSPSCLAYPKNAMRRLFLLIFLFSSPYFAQSISWLSQFGGNPRTSQGEAVTAMVVDEAGNLYVAGYTDAPDFPTKDAYQSQNGRNENTFVMKLDASGNLIFSTYFGGLEARLTLPGSMALDSAGNIWVAGVTSNGHLPVTSNAWAASTSAHDQGFLFKLSADGKRLLYSTYLSPDAAFSPTRIALDATDHVYVLGRFDVLSSYPTTPGAFRQGAALADMLVKFTPEGQVVYATRLVNHVAGMAVTSDGSVLFGGSAPLLGETYGPFRTASGSYVAKLSQDGSAVEWVRYLTDESTGLPLRVAGTSVFALTEHSLFRLKLTGEVDGNFRILDQSPVDLLVDGEGAVNLFHSHSGNWDVPVSPGAIFTNHTSSGGLWWRQVSPGLDRIVYSSLLPSARKVAGNSKLLYVSTHLGASNPSPYVFQTTGAQRGILKIDRERSCVASVSPERLDFSFAGGTADIAVTIPPTCTWYATTGDLIQAYEPTLWGSLDRNLGTGSGSVRLTVPPNDLEARSRVLSVAGRPVTVTQASGCVYKVTPDKTLISADGGSAAFQVESGSNCIWQSTSNTSWISGNSAQFRGNFWALFVVRDRWTGPGFRSGTVTVAGQTFTLTQSDTNCTFEVTPAAVVVPPSAGTATVRVLTHAGCAFVALSQSFRTNHTGTSDLGVPLGFNNDSMPRTYSVVVDGGYYRKLRVPILQQTASRIQQFQDVPLERAESDAISLLARRGITTGCATNPARFCPDAPLTREQMAAFLSRASANGEVGESASEPFFADVPRSHPFFKYIQHLFMIGITRGCAENPRRFCPEGLVTRNEMALFLSRSMVGLGLGVGRPEPYFTDVVADGSALFQAIQQIRDNGVTVGCSSTSYCGTSLTTRAQMALFLTRAMLTP
jgi:hypothetical protein